MGKAVFVAQLQKPCSTRQRKAAQLPRHREKLYCSGRVGTQFKGDVGRVSATLPQLEILSAFGLSKNYPKHSINSTLPGLPPALPCNSLGKENL